MKNIYGHFVERDYISNYGNDAEFLVINFSPTSIPLQNRWRTNGLSADFLADYLSTFFPEEDDESLTRRSEVKGGVSYIANELLENAMKFNHAPAKHPVSIGMELKKDRVVFYVSNCVDPSIRGPFQEYIKRLLTEDPNELYMEKLIGNEADDDESSDSGLGYLTMINDWNATLAWKFEDLEEERGAQKVTIMVQFPFS